VHAKRLSLFVIALLVLNVVAAVVAVVVNLPAQFDGVGTDAGSEVFGRGTALSAPWPPMALLVLVAALARVRSGWGWVAIVAGYLAAVLVFIGGLGELFAEGTVDTPQIVLTASGVVWAVVAVTLVVLTTLALLERLRVRTLESKPANA